MKYDEMSGTKPQVTAPTCSKVSLIFLSLIELIRLRQGRIGKVDGNALGVECRIPFHCMRNGYIHGSLGRTMNTYTYIHVHTRTMYIHGRINTAARF